MTEQIFFTKHAIDQFKKRFPKEVPANDTGDTKLKNLLNRMFLESKETRSHLNDTNYMVHLVEKYGDSDCRHFVKDDVTFVVRGKAIVTVTKPSVSGLGSRTFNTQKNSGFRKRA